MIEERKKEGMNKERKRKKNGRNEEKRKEDNESKKDKWMKWKIFWMEEWKKIEGKRKKVVKDDVKNRRKMCNVTCKDEKWK